MNEPEIKERFVELRAEGVSFDAIAKELNKSKSTLIKWQKEFSREISNLHYFTIQNLLEKYRRTKSHEIEFYLKQLYKINKVLENKDYENAGLKELSELKEKFEKRLAEETAKIRYFTGETITKNMLDVGDLFKVEDVTISLME